MKSVSRGDGHGARPRTACGLDPSRISAVTARDSRARRAGRVAVESLALACAIVVDHSEQASSCNRRTFAPDWRAGPGAAGGRGREPPGWTFATSSGTSVTERYVCVLSPDDRAQLEHLAGWATIAAWGLCQPDA